MKTSVDLTNFPVYNEINFTMSIPHNDFFFFLSYNNYENFTN